MSVNMETVRYCVGRCLLTSTSGALQVATKSSSLEPAATFKLMRGCSVIPNSVSVKLAASWSMRWSDTDPELIIHLAVSWYYKKKKKPCRNTRHPYDMNCLDWSHSEHSVATESEGAWMGTLRRSRGSIAELFICDWDRTSIAYWHLTPFMRPFCFLFSI